MFPHHVAGLSMMLCVLLAPLLFCTVRAAPTGGCGPVPIVPHATALSNDTSLGSRVRYNCTEGYGHTGRRTKNTCRRNGWSNDVICDPGIVYCPWPGTIKNGRILLVGVIGKYEYQRYVVRIGQGEKIEYQCNKGHERVGLQGATCMNGQWTPGSKPECEPERCSLPDSNGTTYSMEVSTRPYPITLPYIVHTTMETVTDHVVHGDEVLISCSDGYRRLQNSTRCDAGAFNPPLTMCEQTLPDPPTNVVISDVTATSIKLTWDASNLDPIESYIIQYKPKYIRGTCYEEITDITNTEYTIMGLDAYTVYEFRVVIVDNNGRAIPGDLVDVTTGELEN